MNKPIPVIDLFAGCGGLSEGFSRWEQSGEFPFEVRLYVEKNPKAIHTLELRAFCRQFRGKLLPDDYYAYVSRNISRETLFQDYPAASVEAHNRCFGADLSNPDRRELDDRVKTASKAAPTGFLSAARLAVPTPLSDGPETGSRKDTTPPPSLNWNYTGNF